MSENKSLDQLGEFGLIEHLSSQFTPQNASTIKGIGDDCAVISISDEVAMVVSTDMLVEGVHFNLMYTPLKHLGYKAVVVNLSDVCAMNAVPEQVTVSIAFSSKFPIEAIDELYKGIKAACDFYNVDLVGGDTSTSYSGLTISITAMGRAKKDKIVYRSGANDFDLVVVTGDLGAAYMGLQVLEREKEVFKANPSIQPELDGYDYVIQRQLKPEARKDVVGFLAELNVQPTAMIDISDGLASEILHICKSSKVGCHIYDEKIPIDGSTSLAAIEFNLDPATCALNGGEDYELLFTIKQADYDKIKGNPHMTVIGHVTDERDGCYFIDKNGSAITIKAQGWNHFGEE
jgi:thiamine-monophosphate kinase